MLKTSTFHLKQQDYAMPFLASATHGLHHILHLFLHVSRLFSLPTLLFPLNYASLTTVSSPCLINPNGSNREQRCHPYLENVGLSLHT